MAGTDAVEDVGGGDEIRHGSLHFSSSLLPISLLTYSLGNGIDDDSLDAESGDESGGDEPDAKRRRVTRKLTPWIFVDRPGEGEGGLATCRLGCFTIKRDGLFQYSARSTSHVIRHLEAKHPQFLAKFRRAQNNDYNLDSLQNEALQQKAASLAQMEKMKKSFDKFFRKAISLDKR